MLFKDSVTSINSKIEQSSEVTMVLEASLFNIKCVVSVFTQSSVLSTTEDDCFDDGLQFLRIVSDSVC